MTAKRANGAAKTASDSAAAAVVLMRPAADSFLISQRIALEAARFWARRLHAYADQMEALACCGSPDEFAAAQRRFIDRMRDDYTSEGKVIGALMTPPKASQAEQTE